MGPAAVVLVVAETVSQPSSSRSAMIGRSISASSLSPTGITALLAEASLHTAPPCSSEGPFS